MSGPHLNTACNLKGEPIVYTPKETFHTFTKSGDGPAAKHRYRSEIREVFK